MNHDSSVRNIARGQTVKSKGRSTERVEFVWSSLLNGHMLCSRCRWTRSIPLHQRFCISPGCVMKGDAYKCSMHETILAVLSWAMPYMFIWLSLLMFNSPSKSVSYAASFESGRRGDRIHSVVEDRAILSIQTGCLYAGWNCGLRNTPPLFTTSLERSVICTKPCSSMLATSPVENQPSLSTASASACRAQHQLEIAACEASQLSRRGWAEYCPGPDHWSQHAGRLVSGGRPHHAGNARSNEQDGCQFTNNA